MTRNRWDETRALIEAGWHSPKCDDGEIMKIWRECGLPEWFLGNGGTNHKLVAFAERVASIERPPIDWDDTKQAQHDGARQIYGGMFASQRED